MENPPLDTPLPLTPSGTATGLWICTGLCTLGGMPGLTPASWVRFTDASSSCLRNNLMPLQDSNAWPPLLAFKLTI
jgi:hypothetical protein